MSIKDTLTEHIKTAMKSGDKQRLAVLRLISAEFKKIEVDKRIDITDEIATDILSKMTAQRRESIKQFDVAGRTDLVAQENYELGIITEYLPAQATTEEIEQLVNSSMAEFGVLEMKDFGKVMAMLKSKLVGRADMTAVSELVKTKMKK